jgi:hypothetical protein
MLNDVVPYRERFALSIAEVAMLTSYSEDTVRRACFTGELESFVVRRRRVVTPAAVEKWISNGKTPKK